MKVYLVIYANWDENRVAGVFATEELAEQYAHTQAARHPERLGGWTVNEYEVQGEMPIDDAMVERAAREIWRELDCCGTEFDDGTPSAQNEYLVAARRGLEAALKGEK